VFAAVDEAEYRAHTSGALRTTIEARIDYLSAKDGAVFFYERGLEKLTFGDISSEIPHFIIAIIMISACLLSFNFVEKKAGVNTLIRATRNGVKRSRASKYLVSLSFIALVYFALYVPYYYGVFMAYGVHGLSAPAYSLEHLSFVPQSATCLGVLIVCMMVRLVVFYLVGWVVMRGRF